MSKTAYIVRFGLSWSGLSPCNPVSERRTVRSATPSSAVEAQLYGTTCRNVAGFSSNTLNYCGYWRMLHPPRCHPPRMTCLLHRSWGSLATHSAALNARSRAWCNSDRIVLEKAIEPVRVEIISSLYLSYCCPTSMEERIANFAVIMPRTICDPIERI